MSDEYLATLQPFLNEHGIQSNGYNKLDLRTDLLLYGNDEQIENALPILNQSIRNDVNDAILEKGFVNFLELKKAYFNNYVARDSGNITYIYNTQKTSDNNEIKKEI